MPNLPNGYRELDLVDFGRGLNLRDKVDAVQVNEAIDALNVVFTNRGAVEQRPGFNKWTTAALTNRVDSLGIFYTVAGGRQLLAGAGTRLEALTTAGAVVASATGLAGGPYTFTRFGTPTVEAAYAGNGTDTLRKWDGAAWSAPTATVDGVAGRAMPKAGIVAIMPADNRLFASGFDTTTGGPNAATSSVSHAYISNPGLPETWETDGLSGRGRNLMQFSPGDGERVMNAVAWRELFFVFKETKFFVISGTDILSNGTPEFKVRPVETGQGLASRRAITVARDGVYFMSRRGVYRTTGGEPQLVSELIDPIFLGGTSSYYGGGELSHAAITKASMAWHEERIYLSIPTGTSTENNRVLVYDTQLKWWSIFDLAASAVATFRKSDISSLMFGYAAGTNDVAEHAKYLGADTDAGATITSRWRSGWSDYSSAVVKTIRETLVSGTGAVNVEITNDYRTGGTLQPAILSRFLTWDGVWLWGSGLVGDTIWGPGTQVNQRLVRKAAQGALFSVRLSNSVLGPTWGVQRLVHHIRERRNTSVVES